MSYSRSALCIITSLCLITLSGCKLTPEKEVSFTSLYTSHVSTQIDGFREFAKDMGYMDSYSANGAMNMMIDVPMILSGAITANYETKIKGQEGEIYLKNLDLGYETLLGSGGLMMKEFAVVTNVSDVFFRYDDLKSFGLIPTEANAIIEKYKNTWLMLTEAELESSLSGSTEDEILSYQISQALASMTLADIEGYMTEYPLWKEKADLGVINGLQAYEVELAKENIVTLFDAFAQKATEKPMTAEAKADLISSLDAIRVDGVMSFDPADTERFIFSGSITPKDDEALPVFVDTGKDATRISLGGSGTMMTFEEKNLPEGTSLEIRLSENNTEVAVLEGMIKKNGDDWTGLNLTFTAPDQGLTVTLNHVYNPSDKSFEGKLNAGVGNMTWKGKMEGDAMGSLQITGAMIGSSLDMNLVSGGDGILKGPLTIKSGDTLVVSADIGLKVNKEQLYFSLDISSPEDPTIRSRALIDISGKRDSWNGTVESPKNTKKFQEFVDEISALSAFSETYDPFIEEESSGSVYPSEDLDLSTLSGSDIR